MDLRAERVHARADTGSRSPRPQAWKEGYTNVNYELPPVVRSIRDGYQGMYQSAAVVSGLLAGAAAQLYSFYKTPSNYSEGTSQAQRDIIAALSYTAVLLNIGATISVFSMMIILGQMQYHAATPSNRFRPECKVPPFVEELTYRESETAVLITEGIPLLLKSYNKNDIALNLLRWHWIVAFVGGILSLGVSVGVYAHSEETPALRAITAVAGLYAVSPLLVAFYVARVKSIRLQLERRRRAQV